MMKRIISAVLVLLFALPLAGFTTECEHQWTEASTEAPRTCSICKATEGDRIITDPRFITADCQELFGPWELDVSAPSEGEESSDAEMEDVYVFNNDGTYSNALHTGLDAFAEGVLNAQIDKKYAFFADLGFTKEETDQTYEELYGHSLDEDYRSLLEPVFENTLNMLDDFYGSGVYYVEGETLYIADSWEDEPVSYSFEVDGDVLTLTSSEGLAYRYLRVDTEVETEIDVSEYIPDTQETQDILDTLMSGTYGQLYGYGSESFDSFSSKGLPEGVEIKGSLTEEDMAAFLEQYGG